MIRSHISKMHFDRKLILSITVVLVALGVACSVAAPEPNNPTSVPVAVSLPDTVGSEVWEYLLGENYQENWTLWPGKGEKYPGVEPHGMLLTTYLNQTALDALNGKAGSMPADAIIVKENFMPDGTLDATTVMYKVSGYNPEHNDWFWTKVKADGSIESEGQVEGCQACHRAKRGNDYVYTGSLSE